MFSDAYKLANQYTRPVIVMKRTERGVVSTSFATYILLNKDGWALTASHVMSDAAIALQHAQERSEYERKAAEIENDASLSPGKKKHDLRQLTKNYEWITNLSYWWGHDGVGGGNVVADSRRDLAAVQLTNIGPLNVTAFPTFAPAGEEMSPGTSLCRLGFPFHTVNGRFDDATKNFRIDNMPPISMFPNDGIHTRIMMQVDANTGIQTKFLETSTPGLRGQSGGPIFDRTGRIWAIQSRTLSLPLGFAPKVKQGGKEFVEHQFIHIGVGAHVDEVRDFLTANKIDFATK
jgi:hypothetical protein